VVYQPVSIEPRVLVPKVIRHDNRYDPALTNSRWPTIGHCQNPMPEIRNYTMNFGPQHPAAHGVLRLVLEMDGEVIQKADPHIGLLHRGTEKLAESKPFNQSIGYMDRLDYVSMMCNEHAYVLAIEKLLGIEPPERAQYIRVMFDEITRILNHLMWLGAHARHRRHDGVPVRVPRARGSDGLLRGGVRHAHARDLLPSGRRVPRPAGHHAASTSIRSGAARRTSIAQRAARARCWISSRPSPSASRRVDEYETLLTDNRIWKQRTVNIGVVSPERAMQLGFSGPMLRGSGVEWDLRKKQPYEVYDRDGFRHSGRRQRRLLRPLPGARRGDAPVEPHHRAVRGVAEGQSGPGDDR
jgi:NADH-quinone oxidoreductase subunit D